MNHTLICNSCNTKYDSLKHFYKHNKCKGGYMPTCKECVKRKQAVRNKKVSEERAAIKKEKIMRIAAEYKENKAIPNKSYAFLEGKYEKIMEENLRLKEENEELREALEGYKLAIKRMKGVA